MDYNRTLDLIFESFIAAKPNLQGKYDRDVRDPHVILNMARQLDLLPDAQKTLKITGSKGKGTVARLCAQALEPFGKVALLVSPEEIDHTDRMRINGKAISKERFCACFKKVWQNITVPQSPAYLSPYGLFLLIALQWFKEEGAELFVIECGRGVLFDEGGQLPAKTGVVTSIFFEHPGYLGPTLEEIRRDKLSISDSCENIVVGATAVTASTHETPLWYQQSHELAQEALRAFLGHQADVPFGPCASFGKRETNAQTLYYEGMIAPESADIHFLQNLPDACFIVSLPDDKDIDGVCALLNQLNAPVLHVILNGERGFLSYEKARKYTLCYEGAYDDVQALRNGLSLPDHQTLYFIGTQTYLRLIKQAYFA